MFSANVSRPGRSNPSSMKETKEQWFEKGSQKVESLFMELNNWLGHQYMCCSS
ncbi:MULTISPECIES: hypothetical protein [Caldilinea]|uniref:Transposase n=1 Tax=Caldilinea aerophila (strain DSM 14535 / JCM 11387 / NBRC 104270 / STL-6-O1) TaxID=926550 RepID=I0I8G4_CALAS|nr:MULTISPECIES: hypothetical protein [Caldilinea]BAM01552.1 hypothetical protein CLDAP_35120 [Caldilinea aerophila DSM 14535 = NBRC 104270]